MVASDFGEGLGSIKEVGDQRSESESDERSDIQGSGLGGGRGDKAVR